MQDYKTFLGGLAVVVALVSLLPYFRDMYKGTTKPHAFSWFVWALLTGIAFVAQVFEGGGPGAWLTGVSALLNFIVFVIALRYGSWKFSRFDWIALVLALLAIAAWKITSLPVLAVILVTIADALGYLPTFRKGYIRPDEETVSTYALSGVMFFISLFALEVFTLTTWLYPLSLVITNALFVTMILFRRRKLAQAL